VTPHTWRCLECGLIGIGMSSLEAALTIQIHLATHPNTTTEQDPAL